MFTVRVVSSAQDSHMINADWIQIFEPKGEQGLPACKVKGHIHKVSVQNSYIWHVKDLIKHQSKLSPLHGVGGQRKTQLGKQCKSLFVDIQTKIMSSRQNLYGVSRLITLHIKVCSTQ